MADAIVTYQGGSWNHVLVPNKGSIVLYPDGLMNVLDSRGRATTTKYDAKRVEFFDPMLSGYNPGVFNSTGAKPTP